MLTNQEILVGKGTRAESSGVREPRRTALPHGARLVQPGWMPERRIPGGGWTGGVSF